LTLKTHENIHIFNAEKYETHACKNIYHTFEY